MSFTEKLKQVFTSFKTYAILIGLALAALISFVFYKNKKAFEFIDLLQNRLKAREEELEALKKVEDEQKKRQEQLELKFQQTLKELEEKHKIEIEKISAAKREELRILLEKYENDPEAQAQHLNQLFDLT